MFTDENNNLLKLDFASRAISPINIPVSEVAFGVDLEYDKGKLATYSSSDPRTIYVWDITTGKKTFEMKLPNDSSVQNGKGFVLKGGVLTVHTSGNFRKDKTYSGTRTYSCPIR